MKQVNQDMEMIHLFKKVIERIDLLMIIIQLD
jgi:hypothetical protein